jgi:hypothetical protein
LQTGHKGAKEAPLCVIPAKAGIQGKLELIERSNPQWQDLRDIII